jgi:signal transduction histidine kinase
MIEFDAELNLSANNNYKVPLDYSRNLQMIAKEIFNNALKHSAASIVQFNIHENSDGVTCFQFMDNGKGFEMTKELKGNGLKNMKRRAERIGATFEIDNEFQNGTIIKICIQPIIQ